MTGLVTSFADLIATQAERCLANGTNLSFDALLKIPTVTPEVLLRCAQRAFDASSKNCSTNEELPVYLVMESLISMPSVGLHSKSKHWEVKLVFGNQLMGFSSQGITCTFKGVKDALCITDMGTTPGSHVIDVKISPKDTIDDADMQYVGTSHTSLRSVILSVFLAVECKKYSVKDHNCQDVATGVLGKLCPNSSVPITQLGNLKRGIWSLIPSPVHRMCDMVTKRQKVDDAPDTNTIEYR